MKELTRADEEIHVKGKTIEEIFENAAKALTEIMANTKTIRSRKTENITMREKDEEELLFHYLEDILLLKDSEQILFKKFSCTIKKERAYFRLHCTAKGDTINKKQELRTDVKGITRHEFSLAKTRKGWEATIVVDV
ncbi:archease [Candidatus Woesearchaeota archaeon]|nr:archease [Candidatus Woesearchaeota archaeon]